MFILEPFLIHPAASLLSWLIAIVALQFLSWPGLAVLAAATLAAGGGVRRHWLLLARRARWLLLTLWLVLAFGTPGDAWLGIPWAPTEAGFHDSTLHAFRLLVMLGMLAWLFDRLPRRRLMAGLWALVRPWQRVGVAADRLVVRLALVFDYLEKSPPKGSWRHLLDDDGAHALDEGLDSVCIELPGWRPADSARVVGVLLLMVAGGRWL